MRFYVKIIFEVCICPGKMQEIEGLAICEKKVVLYGGEGNVHIFKSDPNNSNFCVLPNNEQYCTNLPTAICEVVDPICLNVKIEAEKKSCGCCCCSISEIPENICGCLNGNLADTYDDCKHLYIALGFFSVIRIERPGQYLISATEYCVPEKECIVSEDNDPCSLFKHMSFPMGDFCPTSFKPEGECGCNGKR